MNEAEKKYMPLWTRLRLEMAADKRKAALLVGLLLVAGLLFLRLLFDGPTPASAGAAPVAPSAPAQIQMQTDDEVSLRRQRLAELGAQAAVTRNLFAVDYQAFPVLPNIDASPEPSPSVPTEDTAEEIRLQRLQEQLQTEAEALRLQSVMLGARPTAIIDGRMLTTGDRIGKFVVEKIEKNGCTLSSSGLQVRLYMNQ